MVTSSNHVLIVYSTAQTNCCAGHVMFLLQFRNVSKSDFFQWIPQIRSVKCLMVLKNPRVFLFYSLLIWLKDNSTRQLEFDSTLSSDFKNTKK